MLQKKPTYYSYISWLKLLFFSLVVSVGIQTTFASETQNVLLSQGYREIPLQFTNNPDALIIRIALGDGKFRPFLLDTGSTVTTISLKDSTINALGLKMNGESIINAGSDGNYIQHFHAIVPTFQLKGFISSNEPVFVSTAHQHKPGFIGIIGSDFLRKHHAIIDMGSLRLYVKPQGAASAGKLLSKLLTQAGYKPISLKESPSRHQTLMISINHAKPVRFLFDSGASKTIISSDYAKKHGVRLTKNIGTATGATGGSLKVHQAHIKNLMVGSIPWSQQNIYSTDLQYVSAGEVKVSGTLGVDWMRDNHAVIDMVENTVFIKP